MRTAIILALVAAVAACDDQQQQPTSPVAPRAAAPVTADVGPVTTGIKLPDAKPTDQVGFTKVTAYSTALIPLVVGQTAHVLATCPAGSFMTGGGHTMTPVGTSPSVLQSFPDGLDQWHVVVRNDQAGAQNLSVRAWVLCAS